MCVGTYSVDQRRRSRIKDGIEYDVLFGALPCTRKLPDSAVVKITGRGLSVGDITTSTTDDIVRSRYTTVVYATLLILRPMSDEVVVWWSKGARLMFEVDRYELRYTRRILDA